MSAIWGNSENIYSVRVLLLVTPNGPPNRDANNRGGCHHRENVANRNWDFHGHSRSLKSTFFTSVSDRCPTLVVTKQVRSERCTPELAATAALSRMRGHRRRRAD
jgi:hypothetical protein